MKNRQMFNHILRFVMTVLLKWSFNYVRVTWLINWIECWLQSAFIILQYTINFSFLQILIVDYIREISRHMMIVFATRCRDSRVIDLHWWLLAGDQKASFTKEEMHQGLHQIYEKKLHNQLLAQPDTPSTMSITSSSINKTSTTTTTTTTAKDSSPSNNSEFCFYYTYNTISSNVCNLYWCFCRYGSKYIHSNNRGYIF